ncbi:MAG: hypothetical protein J7M21_00850 [Planctomycetes bacterium]|nr:hypothetical protein [Planctomycetota bacterium]
MAEANDSDRLGEQQPSPPAGPGGRPHADGPACACEIFGGAGGERPGSPPPSDPATQHLADALRTSFRLLGAIMVLGVLAFLAMGFDFVEPGEVAIRVVFGRVVGTTSEGLAYNWPAPIGRIEKIRTGEQTIAIDDFWMNETKKDQLQPDLRKRKAPKGGLRPGWDGALLTGDRNLLHVRLKCTFAVTRQSPPPPPELIEAARRDPCSARMLEEWERSARMPPALRFRRNVQDVRSMMRSVLCEAAIRAAAVRTADGLQRTERTAFEHDVLRLTQRRLDELQSGIHVRAVKVVHSTWPLRTLADYDAAQRAVNDAEKLRSAARGEAVQMLNDTVGPEAARMLVGDPADLAGGLSAASRPQAGGAAGMDYNLIGQYNHAVREGDRARAKALLARIDDVLLSGAVKGDARTVLADARAYRTRTIETVKRRVSTFQSLLEAFRRNPSFTLNRWWVETREAILSQPTAEKHYLTPGRKTVLRINRDAGIVKQVDRALLEKKNKSTGEGGSPGSPGP